MNAFTPSNVLPYFQGVGQALLGSAHHQYESEPFKLQAVLCMSSPMQPPRRLQFRSRRGTDVMFTHRQ